MTEHHGYPEYPEFVKGPAIDELMAPARRGKWCACSMRPLCEYHHCRAPAMSSVWQPSWNKTGQPGRFKFMCEPCLRYWYDAMNTPIKGLDKPRGAPDDWKPSLIEVIRHGEIKLAFERRHERERAAQQPLRMPGDERYSPEQLKQVLHMRQWRRDNPDIDVRAKR